MEERGVDAGVEAPVRINRYLILAVKVPFVCLDIVAAHYTCRVDTVAVAITCHVVLGLRMKGMPGIVGAEAYVMVGIGTIIESHAVAEVVDGGVVEMARPVQILNFSTSLRVLIINCLKLGAVMGIDSREVGKELWRKLILPVERYIDVAPCVFILLVILIYCGSVVAVIGIV